MKEEITYSMEKKGYVQPMLIGKGAFGTVYRVWDKADSKLYACKVADERGRVYLEREADVLRTLVHPLFPGYKDAWQEGAYGFLCMEYIPGCSLEGMVSRRGGLSEKAIMTIALELAEGLLVLHEGGYFFRDLKPANILIRQDGRVKLLDFGCVCKKDAELENIAGTPGFAAPEQLDGRGIGPYTDVYALGKVIQYLLADKKMHGRLGGLVRACIQENWEDRPLNMDMVIRYIAAGEKHTRYKLVEDIWMKAYNKRGAFRDLSDASGLYSRILF